MALPKNLIASFGTVIGLTVPGTGMVGRNTISPTVELSRSVSPAIESISLRAFIDGRAMAFSSVAEKFSSLAQIWSDYNYGRSAINYDHAAYFQIIGMGMPVVPLLLQDLEKGNGNWLLALKYITGAIVTTPEMRGDFSRIKDAWLEWGRQNVSGTGLYR